MNLKEWCKSNGYILSDQLPSNLYRYKDDEGDDKNISVTTILSIIKDPGFDYVLQNNKEAVDKACEEGTRIHKQAEDFHTKGSGINEINKNFMLFHTLYSTEILHQEKTFIKEGIRGTIDNISYCEYYPYWKGIMNIDYKNTSKHSEKYCLQLGGYKWLNGNDGILVYGKGKLKVIEVPYYYEDLFIELKDYFFNLLNKKICD